MSQCGRLPDLVAHADWGKDPAKQWLALARLAGGRYRATEPRQVGDARELRSGLRQLAGPDGMVMAGFDFPIGVPDAYAARAGVARFPDLLLELGSGDWVDFYRVAAKPQDINIRRPFYPQAPGGKSRSHLLRGLGLDSADQLRRRCDLPTATRRAACPVFWTLGANQVGRGAISGWRDVVAPALRGGAGPVRIWPFDGLLRDLLQPGFVVLAETYPAEFYHHLGIRFPRVAGQPSGKRMPAGRQANAPALFRMAGSLGVELDPALEAAISDGFGADAYGDDRFDAVVGLFGVLNVLLGRRASGEPRGEPFLKVEGWILGQEFDAAPTAAIAAP